MRPACDPNEPRGGAAHRSTLTFATSADASGASRVAQYARRTDPARTNVYEVSLSRGADTCKFTLNFARDKGTLGKLYLDVLAPSGSSGCDAFGLLFGEYLRDGM